MNYKTHEIYLLNLSFNIKIKFIFKLYIFYIKIKCIILFYINCNVYTLDSNYESLIYISMTYTTITKNF